MKTTTKKLSDTKTELKVVLTPDELAKARAQAIERLAPSVKVQGFRAGKAPASLVEKNLSPNDIANETIDVAIHATLPVALEQEKVAMNKVLAIQRAEITKYVPEETAEYTAVIELLPEVKLGDYKKLKAKKAETEPTDAEVQEIVDNIVNAYAEKKVVQREAANGDEVIIDFTGKKDGVAFPGGAAKDHHLVLGSGQFIPGFEDGIVGHKAGDSFDLNVTFPKDYPEKSLAGQKAVFETLVKQVNEVVKPKEDAELAKKCGDFKTMDELRADIKKNLGMQNAHRATEKYQDDLVAELVKVSKVSAPDVLVDDQLRLIRDDLNRNAAARGVTFEQYLEMTGQTAEEWEKSARELAEARVKASLVLQTLALAENITVDDADVDVKVAELKDVYKKSKEALENLKKPVVRQEIKNRMVIDKTLAYLVELNDTKKPVKKEAKAKAEKKTSAKK